MQYRFLVKPFLCIGCRTCEMACSNEFSTNNVGHWRWLKEVEYNNGEDNYYLSLSCNHCENPECFRVCPERTYRKRRDGIVVHESRLCGGCGDCIRACPFGAPKYSIQTGKVDKCNFCVHRLDKGLPPACVQACPTGALTLITKEQSDPPLSVRSVQGFDKVFLTRPSTRFLISE
jgi:Fe-S-cluster-containing hydrogenase components 1